MDDDLQHEDCRTTSMNNVTCRTLHGRFCNTDAKKPVAAADPWEINTSELHLFLSHETQYKTMPGKRMPEDQKRQIMAALFSREPYLQISETQFPFPP